MISFTLTCPDHHRFDSWFQSAAAFDILAKGHHLSCPVCGSDRVEKALMAPAVRPARSQVAAGPESETPAPLTASLQAPSLKSPASETDAGLATLRREVEQNCEYVGVNFATEARAIHDGTAPKRAIFGEARLDEARRLIEDGVPIAPLPFLPLRKVN